MPKTDSFETHTERYDAWFETHRYAFESELQAVRTLLPHNGRGVEIGVGTGQFAAKLGIAVGVEPSAAMRQLAGRRGVEAIDGVAEALPLPDASVDYALMVTTVCFLDDIDAAFAEVYRVLAPGGAFVVGLIDRESLLGQEYQRRKRRNVFYKEAVFHSASEVESALRHAGFRKLRAVQTIFEDPEHMIQVDPVKPGYGKGVFVVFCGTKSKRGTSPTARKRGGRT